GKCAGRIVSIVNHRHIQTHNEKAGFFGFFECINDIDVASALLNKVAEALKSEGTETVRGPMNFSTNEECGFLLDGFDEPPMLMTPYNMPYYNKLMEDCGMSKAKDLFAYIYDVRDNLPEKVLRVAAIADKRGIKVRSINKKQFEAEMRIFKEVYNSAWEKNWGFIPLTDDELDCLGNRLKQIVVPELTLIAEDNGNPVGFMGLLPDFNYVLKHMEGKLNPMTIAKALYYSRKIKDLRLLLLGIKKEYRNKGVDAILFREGFKGIKKGRYRRVEFSWILEDNIPIQRIIEMIGGMLYKQYRIYEKRL
ncbi:MAG: N-acetyltransferase, partial [Nitrospirae bacterium]|nr:N-acetyltransferase [Nitrospirota bacterium]